MVLQNCLKIKLNQPATTAGLSQERQTRGRVQPLAQCQPQTHVAFKWAFLQSQLLLAIEKRAKALRPQPGPLTAGVRGQGSFHCPNGGPCFPYVLNKGIPPPHFESSANSGSRVPSLLHFKIRNIQKSILPFASST